VTGAVLALGLLAGGPAAGLRAEGAVTFTRDVAPLLYRHCAGCHHPGAAGPFPLMSYRDAAKRAAFLRDITADHRMPPWKAAMGFGEFRGERRLTDAEVRTLALWAGQGAPRGDPRHLPPAPAFPDGWRLGEPDLVLPMPEPFAVPARGPDVYRCFILPVPLDGDRAVAAVEFRPGNRRVVRHARFFLDDRGQARKKDRADGRPGYPGFGTPGIVPSGSLGGWGLASAPGPLPDGCGVPLPRGSDLVLQLHYRPSGKAETDRSAVGLYFTRRPPTRFVTHLFVEDPTLAIPAGRRHRVAFQSEPLPAAVRLRSVAPHMHNLGREIEVTAALPGGEVRPLVWVRDWDVDWQEVYQFSSPVRLPRGSVVRVEALFDNTADNPKNPNHPPKPVRYGDRETDEMCGCDLEVIADGPADLRALEAVPAFRLGARATRER
jgi:hypothetical protein